LLSVSDLEKIPDSKYEELMVELRKRNGRIKALEDKIEALESREEKISEVDEDIAPILKIPKVQTAIIEALKGNPEITEKLLKVKISTFFLILSFDFHLRLIFKYPTMVLFLMVYSYYILILLARLFHQLFLQYRNNQ